MIVETQDGATGTSPSDRLVGAVEWFWYLAAAVSYIGLSIWHKWLLGWLVGPMWLVVSVSLGPPLVARLRRRVARRSERAGA